MFYLQMATFARLSVGLLLILSAIAKSESNNLKKGETAEIKSRSRRQLPGMKMLGKLFGRYRETTNFHGDDHYPPHFPGGQLHGGGGEPHIKVNFKKNPGSHEGRDHQIHEIHDPYKGHHEIHDPHKGYGHDIHHEIHDPHKGYGHDIHHEIHDPHKGGYGHDVHHHASPHKGYHPGGAEYGPGSKLSGYTHADEVYHPTYKGKPKKVKYGPYKGPNYGPYDLVAPDKSKKGKKSKYGDDPVKETKKGGYHKEKVTEHFGGFGGGGSVGSKAKGYGHSHHGGGYGHGGGGHKKGHKGGHKGGHKKGYKGGGFSHHHIDIHHHQIHHEPVYHEPIHHIEPIFYHKSNEHKVIPHKHLEKPKNTYDPHTSKKLTASDIYTHADISDMLISDPYKKEAALPLLQEPKESSTNLKAESRL